MKKNVVNNNNIFQKVFYCCSGFKDETQDVKFEFENSNINDNIDLNNQNKSNLINALNKYIRPDEKNKIQYSKQGILEFIKNLQNLDYSTKYESGGYKISMRDSSDLSKDCLLMRFGVKIEKNLFKSGIPNIKQLLEVIKDPDKNLRWNINNKEFIILEKINDNKNITKKILVRQMNIISEKEFYNKRIYFLIEGNAYYFTSSIPDNLYPPKDKNFRALNYFEILIIKEDYYNFCFEIFLQQDIKMSLPQTFLMLNLPEKLKDYFDKLIEYFNS